MSTEKAARTDVKTFSITAPRGEPVPFLFNSPHSGDVFPEEFLARSQLSRETMRRASDLYVDRLVVPLNDLGATIMCAHLPRSYLDLNREPLELDPRLISGHLPPEANTHSLRVAGGLGTVPRVIGDQIEIYSGKLGLGEAMTRIEKAYLPYHQRLNSEMQNIRHRHGYAVLIDWHSMPSVVGPRPNRTMPDIVLGDRFGTSCAPELAEAAECLARGCGLSVERNQPYAGGYITEFYGQPSTGWHALQIEINRGLYMDEIALLPHSGFLPLAKALRTIMAGLIEARLISNIMVPAPLSHAAE